MGMKYRYSGIRECLVNGLVEAFSEILGVDKEVVHGYFSSGRLRIDKTPDPSLGDYGVALHYIFHRHGIGREDWRVFVDKVSDYLEKNSYFEKCFIVKTSYVNGYLNFYIDYNRLFIEYSRSLLSGEVFSELKNIGRGEKILVEHTSANPIHPLHIGSGRNSVIGNTYARLLRYLGYSVSEHFYVDDMGRQVAILIYGYRFVREHGLNAPENVKPDHWFGAIYAVTNILIEKNKIIEQLYGLENRFREIIGNLEKIFTDLLIKHKSYPLLDILAYIKSIEAKLDLKHDILELVDKLLKLLEKWLDKLDGENKAVVEKEIDQLNKYYGKYRVLYSSLKEYLEAESILCKQYPSICRVLSSKIKEYAGAEEEISRLMVQYEEGDPEITRLFREAVEKVLDGFKETLEKLGIVFDSFDWESGEPGRKYLREVLEKAGGLPYSFVEDGALIIDLDKAAEEHRYIRELFGRDQPGRVVLRRRDGSTLYVTRDTVYSIYKFRDLGFSKAYNVIAVEQVREQRQVKALLYLLGYRDIVDKLIHFSYEMVNLKGMRMSSRRGQYYSLDELINDYTYVVAEKYVSNKLELGVEEIETSPNELLEKFRLLGIACSRALLLSIDPSKVLVFDPRRLEEYDLGAWIIYTFVRIQSILRKAYGFEPLDNIDSLIENGVKLLKEIGGETSLSSVEKNLLEILTNYSSTLYTAYSSLEPNKILEYTRDLCMVLNKLYETHPILGEKDRVKRNTRLLLVIMAYLLLKDLLWIMGLPYIKKL